MQIDLFCSVIDNYGDAGVSWRLARVLADDGRFAVRLWIDDPYCLGNFVHGLDPSRSRQTCEGIEVRRWHELDDFAPGAVVIEAFGCRLPELVQARMAARSPQPVWINLEYLATEDWADDCHGLPSPHPSLPLQKYFFIPGFGEKTGGLIREAGLFDARDGFRDDPAARAAFAARMGVSSVSGALHVSLFCYPDSPLGPLLDAWRTDDQPTVCLVPQAVAEANRQVFGGQRILPGTSIRQDALTIRVIPFLSQSDYDRLLWSCDLNFVRGEDSFVRAQWAAQPFVWQAYRQASDAHHDKVGAFLDRYLDAAPASVAESQRSLFAWWNGMSPDAPAWHAVRAALPQIGAHARRWSRHLGQQPSLVEQLARFIESKLK